MPKKRNKKHADTKPENKNAVREKDALSASDEIGEGKNLVLYFLENYGFAVPVLIALLVYFKTFTYGFVNLDDNVLIVHYFDRISSLSRISAEFFEVYMVGCFYRPLVTASFILDAQISGVDPSGYHVTNFLLHAAAVTLVFYLFKALKFPAFTAFAASLIYAVHPVFVNAVAWLVGRNDTLVTVFVLISFIFFIKYINQKKYFFLFLHLLFYLFAMLSKEVSLSLPFLLLLFYFLTSDKIKLSRQIILAAAGWAVLITVWYLMRTEAFEDAWCKISVKPEYFITNIATIPEFISKFFLPVNLSVLPVFKPFHTIAGIVLAGGMAAAYFFIKNKRNNLIILGAVWFLLFTVPGMFSRILIADHWNEYLECRTYLPLAGLMIASAGFFPAKLMSFKNKSAVILLIVITLLFAVLSRFETRYYSDPQTFFESAAADNPNRSRIRYHYALTLKDAGELDKAEEQLIKSIELNPEWGESYGFLGEIYFGKKEYKKAIPLLEMSLDKFSINKESYFEASWKNLTLSYLKTEDTASAKNLLIDILASAPKEKFALDFLQRIYFSENKIDSALLFANRLLAAGEFNRVSSMVFNKIAIKHAEEGRFAEALKYWEPAYRSGLTPEFTGWNLFKFYFTMKQDYPKAAYIADYLTGLGKTIPYQDYSFLKDFPRDTALFKP